MHIALIADIYPPRRSSGAVQLRDLARELVMQGHSVNVLTPEPELINSFAITFEDGVQVIRIKSFRTRDTSYARRTLSEFALPFVMHKNLKKSPVAKDRYDGVVWYSPTIFLGPIVQRLKQTSGCPSYLIIRDIFPEWANDMGLMSKGLPFKFFQAVANFQYRVADCIGVQTPGNLTFFQNRHGVSATLEVLHNWLSPMNVKPCSIQISETSLQGRKILVYAGNLGVAQGVDSLLHLADALLDHEDIGLVFVGRGTEAERLKAEAVQRNLSNVIFFDEIHPDEISGLYAQAKLGLVALDQRHKTHNIPGKFISYMHCGLPVFAAVNPGNDLFHLIETQALGGVFTNNKGSSLKDGLLATLQLVESDVGISNRCRAMAENLFSASSAALQITNALESLT